MNDEEALTAGFMEKYFRLCRALGFTVAGSPEEFFGFHCGQVSCVFMNKSGFGSGAWFRLHDGRVFDMMALPDDPDPGVYDQTAH